MVHGPNSYWVLGWLDQTGANDIDDIERLLADPKQLSEMRDLAEAWKESVTEFQPNGINLLAGTGLNFANDITCPGPACRERQIDVLFRHAWHYFDKIMLPDSVGEFLLSHDTESLDTNELQGLVNDISFVHFLRESDAINLLNYYARPPHECSALDHARERFDSDLTPGILQEIKQTMVEHGQMKVERLSPTFAYVYYLDPFQLVGSWIPVEENNIAKREDEELMGLAAHTFLFDKHLAYFDHDLETAYQFRSALGSTLWTHAKLLTEASIVDGSNDIAFHLDLPSLKNVPIGELISIRAKEGDAFERFRDALRLASKQALQSHEMNIDDLAAEIAKDIIEPELRRIQAKLRAAQTVLARKTTSSLFLGTVATTCGLLAGLPEAVATGFGIGSYLTGVRTAVN